MEKIILFDLDGTLIDSTDAIVDTFLYSFDKNNFDFKGTKRDITKLIGYPLDIMYKQLGIEPKDIQLYVDTYKTRYREISLAQTKLLPHARESVKLAASFARLGIVTTKTTKYTIPLLEDMGLLQYFEIIIGRQEVKNPKPHPEPILKAMESLNVSTDDYDIFMIGDTKLDLIAAKEADIYGIGVLCGYGEQEELARYSDVIVTDSLLAVNHIKTISK